MRSVAVPGHRDFRQPDGRSRVFQASRLTTRLRPRTSALRRPFLLQGLNLALVIQQESVHGAQNL